MWTVVSENGKVDKFTFRKHFGSLHYTGSQSIASLSFTASSKAASLPGSLKTSSQPSRWESNVFEKLRVLLKVSTRSMHEIFSEFNPSGNGKVT